MFDRSYVVMDRLPGRTLHELTYRKPEVLEEHKVTIAYQLGMHTAFSYVFGARDGFQTNYVFDPVSKILTRIDKESFLEVPASAGSTLSDLDPYTQEIAACELTNLRYIPTFRSGEWRTKLLIAFRQGFLDKYGDVKTERDALLDMIIETRQQWLSLKPVKEQDEYHEETKRVHDAVAHLMEHDPEKVFDRLLKAKVEVDAGKYRKK